LQTAFAEEAEFPSWKIALRGERAGTARMLDAVRSGTTRYSYVRKLVANSAGPQRPNTPFDQARDWFTDRFTSDVRSDMTWLLRHYTDLLSVADRPTHEQAVHVREHRASVDGAPELTRALLTPAWHDKAFVSFQTGQARLRCAAVALAVERYRLAHGAWPASLGDLTPGLLPSVPLDPFDGKPLRFRRLADGVVVYAVGPDGTDDGGELAYAVPAPAGKDVGFRLWDARRRRK
jgi:hypothetical protein